MVNESNPFKDYTNHLAKTLQEKNKEAMDKFTGDKWRKKFQEKAEQKRNCALSCVVPFLVPEGRFF